MAKAGILHPGLMGVSVAVSIQKSGHDVYWVSDGRSSNTQQRAAEYKLRDAGTLEELCSICDLIVSVCPPHAAEQVADQVIASGFHGVYLDANATSPERAVRIEKTMNAAGVTFVDGGIIGGPAWKSGETCLYMSGTEAEAVAAFFAKGALEVRVIGEFVGKASALKMCYGAYTKGTTALLSAILAASESLGVRLDLETEWGRSWGDFTEQTHQRVRRETAKAWRFEGEMEEIAATFASAGLPDGFHKAAAEIYHRTAGFKDSPEHPPLEAVLAALIIDPKVNPEETSRAD